MDSQATDVRDHADKTDAATSEDKDSLAFERTYLESQRLLRTWLLSVAAGLVAIVVTQDHVLDSLRQSPTLRWLLPSLVGVAVFVQALMKFINATCNGYHYTYIRSEQEKKPTRTRLATYFTEHQGPECWANIISMAALALAAVVTTLLLLQPEERAPAPAPADTARPVQAVP